LSSYKGLHLMATDAGLQTTGSSTVQRYILYHCLLMVMVGYKMNITNIMLKMAFL
jgi:hypothetical protein